MERILIIVQFDPERPQPGGIDTCVRGMIKYHPPGTELRIVGVDAIGNKRLGEWDQYEVGGRQVAFMPVARVDHADLTRKVPHSVRLGLGLLRYRPASDADIVHVHHLHTGALALRLYPHARLVQILHGNGVNNLATGSESFFRYSIFAYRQLEKYVLPRAADIVVFNKAGAERMKSFSDRVRFSPTWFDPDEFFPAEVEIEPKRRILWVGRIEPPKNPDLAVDIMSLLPDRYSLTVAGSGTLDAAMRQRARNSPAAERITFVGPVPKPEMGALMRRHSIMLMTSHFEGFSIALVEALASGLPVVTTPGAEPNGLVVDGINGARVAANRAELFVPAVELAAGLASSAARQSVEQLNAAVRVPDVFDIPW